MPGTQNAISQTHTDVSKNQIFNPSQMGSVRFIFPFREDHLFDRVRAGLKTSTQLSYFLFNRSVFIKTGVRGFYTGRTPIFSHLMLKEIYRVWALRFPVRGYVRRTLSSYFPDSPEYVASSLSGAAHATSERFLVCPLKRLYEWIASNKQYKYHSNYIRPIPPLYNEST